VSLLPEYHLDHPPTLPLRPTRVEVDSRALEHNLRCLAKRAGLPVEKVMAVVKANGYGHGLLLSARALQEAGVGSLAVGFVEEGLYLRREGIQLPILVLGGLVPSQIPVCIENALDMTVSSLQKAKEVIAYFEGAPMHAKNAKRACIHVKVDCDMRRIGLRPDGLESLIQLILGTPALQLKGIYTHLACASEEDASSTLAVIDQFITLKRDLCRRLNLEPVAWHLANSASSLRFKHSAMDLIRPGLALYGLNPFAGLESAEGVPSPPYTACALRPALRWVSQVVYFKVVEAGLGVSYGHQWSPSVRTRLVTIPVGYGDGYARCMTGKASVLIRGHRYPVVGTICMDQILVDVGPEGEAYNGDEVVLVGRQGDEEITVEDLATWQETISYEVTTRISDRVPRFLLESS
jgi:alanine racemase